MLKPATRHEKLEYTIKFQGERAINELLSELIEQGYQGYVDIWFSTETKEGEVLFKVESKKITHKSQPLTNPNTARFHIEPSKGAKLIK